MVNETLGRDNGITLTDRDRLEVPRAPGRGLRSGITWRKVLSIEPASSPNFDCTTSQCGWSAMSCAVCSCIGERRRVADASYIATPSPNHPDRAEDSECAGDSVPGSSGGRAR